jgi:hypothetical protein
MLDIAPEKEMRLQEQARGVGLPVEDYVLRVLDERLGLSSGAGQETPEYRAHKAEFEAIAFHDDWMDIFRSVGVPCAVMSQEATRRASLYEDDL